MSVQVTLKLRDEIITIARDVAARTQRDIEDILAQWLNDYTDDLPVESLSDEQVLLLCEYELSPMSQHELRRLLCIHRERDLSIEENISLDSLLRTYRKGIVRKARAFEVARGRGLLVTPYVDEPGETSW